MRAVLVAVLCVASAGACKRSAPPAPPASVAASTDARPAAAAPEPPRFPVGMAMTSAFERLDASSTKSLAAGQAALRAKKFPAARERFHLVVAAHPDHAGARFQELRAAVLGGDVSDVRDLWRELLARDYLGYATKLDTGAEFAALRASPLWPELVRTRGEVQAEYAKGLGRGAFFVARSRPAKEQLWDEKARPVLELFQEAYQFDPAAGRVRRLTDSGGQVFAILPDRERKQLLLLLVQGLEMHGEDSGWSFLLFKAAVLSLETLETTGPAEIPNKRVSAPEVVMCVSDKGRPLWTATASYAFDPAHKRVVSVTGETCAPGTGVRVTNLRGERRRSLPQDVGLGVGRSLTVGGATVVPHGDSVIRSESVGWSPAKTRLLFSGDLDPCTLDMHSAKRWPPEMQNALLAWEVAAKRVTPIAKAFSFFEWDWLDDDHLVYETGTQSNPRIAVHDFSTGKDLVVETRAGAGLVAVPSFTCVYSSAEDSGADEDGAE